MSLINAALGQSPAGGSLTSTHHARYPNTLADYQGGLLGQYGNAPTAPSTVRLIQGGDMVVRKVSNGWTIHHYRETYGTPKVYIASTADELAELLAAAEVTAMLQDAAK